jgi:hypothetical protein
MFKLRFYQIVPVAVAGLFSVVTQIALAAPMSTSEMVLALRESKVVSPTSNLLVRQSADQQEVTIITKRLKMNDSDCKIKAVLMAKALMDLQPKQLAAVKVIYTIDGQNAVDRVVVGAGDVQSFANGTTSEVQLLKSLDLTRESGDGSDGGKASVAEGPQKERRDILQSRIEALKQGGTGVAPFQKMFNDIEDLTKAGKAKEASQLISDLSTKLSSQESLRDQARRVGAGGGVKGQQGTHSASSADLGPRQPWRPGGGPGNNAQAQQANPGIINMMKNKLDEMERNGHSVGQLRAELRDVENSRVPAGEVCNRLEALKGKMMQQERQPRR